MKYIKDWKQGFLLAQVKLIPFLETMSPEKC